MIIIPNNYANPTFVVCGTPFSGTSVVAGTLRLLGVHMGRKFTSHMGTHQDIEIGTWRSYRQRLKTIEARDQAYPVWGFKSVDMNSWFDDLFPHLREPVFLFCSRGLADTLEKVDSQPYALGGSADLVAHLTEDTFWSNFFLTHKVPWCLLKYKADPAYLLDQIIEFTGIEPDDRQKVLDFNNPQLGYTEVT